MSAILTQEEHQPGLIRLEEWAALVYGANAPSAYTLRRWARDGNIAPAPEKHGRTYFVVPGARYVRVKPNGRPHRRLKDRMNVPATSLRA